MKKLLIIATALIFAASTPILASQNQQGQPQSTKSKTIVKHEAQKPIAKDETKAAALDVKTAQVSQANVQTKKTGDNKTVKNDKKPGKSHKGLKGNNQANMTKDKKLLKGKSK